MSIFSFALFVIAAVLFAVSAMGYGTASVPEGRSSRYHSLLRWGLVVLTLAFMAQFVISNRPIHT